RGGGPLAVKVLRDDARDAGERFAREAAILQELRHPGIVRYVDHGTMPDGTLYLPMEWLGGGGLGAGRGAVGARCARARPRRPRSASQGMPSRGRTWRSASRAEGSRCENA